MAEAAPIGLSWAPKLPSLPTTSGGKKDSGPSPSNAQGSVLSLANSPLPPKSPLSKRAPDGATLLRCRAALSENAALRVFHRHHVSGRALHANPALMPALVAYARLPSAAAEAEQIHALLVKSGAPPSASGVYASTSLVCVYTRLGRLGDARKVFDGMPVKMVVSWNVVLDRLVRASDLDAVREVFVEIPERNVVSWNTVIAGFARHGWA